MIGVKIRKITDFTEREILMNSIQNLLFRSVSWSVTSDDEPVDIESGSSCLVASNHTPEISYS